jgi:hypothetical protein
MAAKLKGDNSTSLYLLGPNTMYGVIIYIMGNIRGVLKWFWKFFFLPVLKAA